MNHRILLREGWQTKELREQFDSKRAGSDNCIRRKPDAPGIWRPTRNTFLSRSPSLVRLHPQIYNPEQLVPKGSLLGPAADAPAPPFIRDPHWMIVYIPVHIL